MAAETIEEAPSADSAASMATEEVSATVTVAPTEAESTIVDDDVVLEETPAVEASSIVVQSSPAVINEAQSTAAETNKPTAIADEQSALAAITTVSPPGHEETSGAMAVEPTEHPPGSSSM
jgi:hypothetical protein